MFQNWIKFFFLEFCRFSAEKLETQFGASKAPSKGPQHVRRPLKNYFYVRFYLNTPYKQRSTTIRPFMPNKLNFADLAMFNKLM